MPPSPLCYFITVESCFELGRLAYLNSDFQHSLLWMEQTLNNLDRNLSDYKEKRLQVLDYMAFSMFKVCWWGLQGLNFSTWGALQLLLYRGWPLVGLYSSVLQLTEVVLYWALSQNVATGVWFTEVWFTEVIKDTRGWRLWQCIASSSGLNGDETAANGNSYMKFKLWGYESEII